MVRALQISELDVLASNSVRYRFGYWMWGDDGGGGEGGPDASPDSDASSIDANSSVSVGETVSTDEGAVTGSTMGNLRVFLGVPYAQAPTGDNQFRPPQPLAIRDAPFSATAFGPACHQIATSKGPEGDDCLRVNIWAHPENAEPKPVLVWVHGGGFVEGAGSEPAYDGAVFAENRDLVVVTINYRLGALGFLALPQLAAADGGTGNWGLRDQIAALEWIKSNVANFGGDPNRMMIAGESAGGASICSLLASPLSAGLFSAASVQSGPCRLALKPDEPTGNFRAAYASGLDVAIRVGCTDAATIASCLRNTAPTELIAAQAEIAPVRDLGFAIGEFLPLIDGVVLTQPLTDAIAAGASDVPLIVGSNREDASFFAAGEIGNDGFAAYLERVFPANRDALLAMYPPATLTELGAATALITDIAFSCEAERLGKVAASGAPAYLYELNRGGSNRSSRPFHGCSRSRLPLLVCKLRIFRKHARIGERRSNGSTGVVNPRSRRSTSHNSRMANKRRRIFGNRRNEYNVNQLARRPLPDPASSWTNPLSCPRFPRPQIAHTEMEGGSHGA